MPYNKKSFLLTEAEKLFAPTVDDLLYLAEIEAIRLYVYAADYFVLWKDKTEHERIKSLTMLCPHYALALRVNRKKNINYVGKIVSDQLITGSLFKKGRDEKYIKAPYKVGIENIIVTQEELKRIEAEEISSWKDLRGRMQDRGEREYVELKKGINKQKAYEIVTDLFLLIEIYDESSVVNQKKDFEKSDSTIGHLKVMKQCLLLLADLKADLFAKKDGKVLAGYRQKYSKEEHKSIPVGVIGHLRKYITKEHSISNLQKYISQALELE